MTNIHEKYVQCGKQDDFINYLKGANIVGFLKVADAMLGLGIMQPNT